MRFTTYLRNNTPRLAVIDGDDLVDLNGSQPEVPADMRAALAAGIDLQAAGRKAIDSKAARIPMPSVQLAPLV